MARARVDAERRAEILDAFESCVIRRGIDGTTLEDIACEAGKPRALVRYFAGNREALVTQLIDRLFERTIERVQEMRVRSGGDRARLAKLYFDEFFADEHSNRIVVELWRMSFHREEIRIRLFSLYTEILRDLTHDLAHLPDNPEAGVLFDNAYAAFSLGLGMAVLRGLGVNPVDSERLTQLANALALGDVRTETAFELFKPKGD